MPWILWGPLWPPESTGDAEGSTAITVTEGFFDLRYFPAPVTVPPVPTPPTRMSISPLVSAQISGPVVFSWIAGFAGVLNCWGMKELGMLAASSSALAMAPYMPLAPSVSSSSAPRALRSFRRSILMVSGMVRMIR